MRRIFTDFSTFFFLICENLSHPCLSVCYLFLSLVKILRANSGLGPKLSAGQDVLVWYDDGVKCGHCSSSSIAAI